MTSSNPDAMKTVELLAPARDLAVAIAAIDNGADAVYIGAPAFDFKGVNACIDEVGKAGGEVEVFEGEDVAVVDKEAPPGVTDCPFLTAGLGAFATVGGAAEEALGEVALPAEADA